MLRTRHYLILGLSVSTLLVFCVCTALAEEPASGESDATDSVLSGESSQETNGSETDKTADPLTDDEVKELLGGDDTAPVEPPTAIDETAMETINDVWTDPGEIPRFKIDVGGEKYDLPLKHTHVDAKIVGSVAHVEVKQTYENPLPTPIETVYVFPLPENSAVNDMEMEIGERIVKAEIQTRNQARTTYETAKKEGHTASLLEQERPNIFTQSVANIAPKETIDVTIRYVQDLTYDAGEYEFVFPMVVGPRYIPGNAVGKEGTGWSPDTTEVGDASRITPPVVGGGMRSGHDISVHVEVDAGLPVQGYSVPTHNVAAETSSDGVLDLSLAEAESIPNRDFVLRYEVAGENPVATLLTRRDEETGGYFTLIVQPPKLDVDDLVGNREFIFVVDVSGSMSGKPLAMAKDAMQQSLRGLRPKDTFNVIVFASREDMLWSTPHPANNTNLVEAMGFIDGLSAGGGTEMKNAIDAAFEMEGAKDRHRYVFFMTDGFVGNEKTILSATKKFTEEFPKARPGQRSRVFGFGIGSSPNRHLIEGLGEAGDGASVYATNREDPTRAVNSFFGLVDRPVITDIEIDWGDLNATEVYPSGTPDLFATRPLILHGRFDGAGKTEVVVSGKVSGEPVDLYIPVTVDKAPHGDPVHATLWARSKVGDLQTQLWAGYNANLVEQVEAVGLEYHLVTAYTSLVAVDYERTVEGELKQIVQPVDAPEDVDLDKAMPEQGQAGSFSIQGKTAASGEGDSFGVGYGYGGMGTAGRGSGSGSARIGAKSSGASKPKLKPATSKGNKGKVAPRVKPGKSTVMGSMDHDAIRRVIRKKSNAYKVCYEKALREDPELGGKLIVKFVIDETGAVTSVEITTDTVGDEDLAACVTKVTERLSFPAPSGGEIVIKYPFVFSPE